MPNRFWKDTPQPSFAPRGIGNSIQQATAANNPDIFCETQGSGYRLPSIHEYETDATATTNPGYPRQPQLPAHWSAYVNNDVTGKRKVSTAVNARTVSGAISNEWGDLTKYGWSSGNTVFNYWTSEISLAEASSWRFGYGRIYFNVQNMTGYGVDAIFDQNLSNNPYNANQLYRVACVRDLVPTPATPVPGKS